MKKVAVIAFDGCWAMSVFLSKDFFRVVNLMETNNGMGESYSTKILTHDGNSVLSSSLSEIIPDDKMGSERFDIIIIPPIEGRLLNDLPESTNALASWLKPYRKSSTTILCMSTGIYFWASSCENNEELHYVSHWAFKRKLETFFPHINFSSDSPYLKNDNVYSSSTFDGAIDALLAILAHDKGDQFSQLCATYLLVSEPQKLSPILPQFRTHKDSSIYAIQDWIEANLETPVSISALANRFHFSERNIKRRFALATGTSINKYLQAVRIDKAKKLLLATEMSIKEVSQEVGYENDSFFSRLFKRNTGSTPAMWRFETRTTKTP